MKAFPVAVLWALLPVLIACDNDAHRMAQKLEAENQSLRRELAAVKAERDELRFGAQHLLAQSESRVQAREWESAKEFSEQLLSRHPAAPEAKRAREILVVADAALTRAAKAAEAAEVARKAAAAQERLADERRLAASLSKMRTSVDKIEGVTWYRDRSTPRFTNYNSFHLYLGKQSHGEPWLRFRVQYNADDWLFIEPFVVVADGQRFEYDPAEFARDSSSEIWEWYDETASPRDLAMIRAVISSKEAVIRFNGKQYRKDRSITASEKRALQNVLDAYQVLGGS
jgi:hypothetical protein